MRRATNLGLFGESKLSIQPTDPAEHVVTILREVNKDSSDSAKPPGFESQVNEWIDAKSAEYQRSQEAKNDPNLLGNYEVSFVGTGKDQRNEGNPAGGRYRGAVGRLFFETQSLFQNLLKGDHGETVVINVVKGRLLKLVPFCVILFGVVRFLSVSERDNVYSKYRNKLSTSAVYAAFRPPVLCFGSPRNPLALSVKVGPPSSVVLDTPYVCPQVRLGLGSRGSRFVFTRTADPAADEWKAWLSRKHVPARRAGVGLVLMGMLVAVLRPFSTHKLALSLDVRSVAGFLLSLLGVLVAVSSGGIIDNDTSK